MQNRGCEKTESPNLDRSGLSVSGIHFRFLDTEINPFVAKVQQIEAVACANPLAKQIPPRLGDSCVDLDAFVLGAITIEPIVIFVLGSRTFVGSGICHFPRREKIGARERHALDPRRLVVLGVHAIARTSLAVFSRVDAERKHTAIAALATDFDYDNENRHNFPFCSFGKLITHGRLGEHKELCPPAISLNHFP